MTHAESDVYDQDDIELTNAARQGHLEAFGELYRRHRAAALRLAWYLPASTGDREDLVAEAFARVLRSIRDSTGPRENFRSYLLVSVRNVAMETARKESLTTPCAEMPDGDTDRAPEEQVLHRLTGATAGHALSTLPRRWRIVLWRTEVERKSHATIGSELGLQSNSVAALAYRAREGLRHAYLRLHIPESQHPRCRLVAAKLPRWVRDQLSDSQRAGVRQHLDRCPACRAAATELTQVNEQLHGTLSTILLATATGSGVTAAGPAVAGSLGSAAGHALGAAVNTAWLGKAYTAATALALASATAIPGATGPGPADPSTGEAHAVAGPATTSTTPGPEIGNNAPASADPGNPRESTRTGARVTVQPPPAHHTGTVSTRRAPVHDAPPDTAPANTPAVPARTAAPTNAAHHAPQARPQGTPGDADASGGNSGRAAPAGTPAETYAAGNSGRAGTTPGYGHGSRQRANHDGTLPAGRAGSGG